MNTQETASQIANPSKPVPQASLTPPPMPARPGERNGGSTQPNRPFSPLTDLDINDKDAVREAVRIWMEEPSNQRCIA